MAERTECVRCGVPLGERFRLCEDCDLVQANLRAEYEQRMEQDAIAANLRRSGLPAAYASGERRMGDVPMIAARATDACLLLGASVAGLYLHGPARTFKTSVAAAYLASQIRGGGRGLFVSVPKLMDDITATYKADSGESKAALVERLVNTPMLVMDDLGKEKGTEHSARVLFEILDGRWQQRTIGRWTIITSNYGPNDIAFRFDIPEEDREPIRHRLANITVAIRMDRAQADVQQTNLANGSVQMPKMEIRK